jgi:VanZ family protein
LLKANKKLIAYGITAVILYLSLAKIPSTNSINISHIDKLYHGIAYFFLSFSWLFAFETSKVKMFWIAIGCILFGIVIEGLQALVTNYRSADFIDIIANTLGCLSALALYTYFFKKV